MVSESPEGGNISSKVAGERLQFVLREGEIDGFDDERAAYFFQDLIAGIGCGIRGAINAVRESQACLVGVRFGRSTEKSLGGGSDSGIELPMKIRLEMTIAYHFRQHIVHAHVCCMV